MNYEEKSPQKRVLFVITQSEYGGAQRFLYNLVARLGKTKYKIEVAVGAQSGKEFLSKLTNTIKITRVESLKRDVNFFYDLKAVNDLSKVIIQFQPDVLFMISSKAGFVGSLALRKAAHGLKPDKKIIKTIYRIGGWSFNDPRSAWKKLIFIILEKIGAKWKNLIIVNNTRDLEQAKRYNIKPKEGMVMIPNGLDVYKMDFMPKDEARLKLFESAAKQTGKIFQAKTIIGTIANFYPSKGLTYLIEAAEYFKNNHEIVFFIIGDGPERPTLEKMIYDKGLGEKIFLFGQIPDAYRYLPAFDIFVLASIKEGSSWALIEAMAAKLPVIATSVGTASEIIEDDKNGSLIVPSNSELLAGKIKENLNNKFKMQEMGIQAHQTIVLKYDLQKMVRQIEEIM